MVSALPTFNMAAPAEMWRGLRRFRPLFLGCSWQSLWRPVAGLGLTVVVGAAPGMVMGISRMMNDAPYPLPAGIERQAEGHCGAGGTGGGADLRGSA